MHPAFVPGESSHDLSLVIAPTRSSLVTTSFDTTQCETARCAFVPMDQAHRLLNGPLVRARVESLRVDLT